MHKRSIGLDIWRENGLFVWGARQTGKSTLMRRRCIAVSLDAQARVTDDGIEVLPWRRSLDRLWADGIL